MKSYQDRLISTVHWSLGILATIAVLLVGFGWFVNFRVYERDKASLVQELRSLIDLESQKARQQFDKHIVDSKKEIDGVIKSGIAVANNELQLKLKELFSVLVGRLAKAELTLCQIEHARWIKEEVFTNALRTAIEILKHSLSQPGWSWYISRSLETIKTDLTYIKTKNPKLLDADGISNLVKVLEEVGSEHKITVDAIRQLLASIGTA